MLSTLSNGDAGSVSVIGCGFLGFPLARLLVSDGFTVRGSTTTAGKLPMLSAAGISGHLFDLTELDGESEVSTAGQRRSENLGDVRIGQPSAAHGEKESARTDLFEAEVIVVNIPPGRRDPERQAKYAGWMKVLRSRISSHSYIVFASSTSVYPDTIEVADIDSAAPHSDGAAALLEAERAFQHHGGGCTIIRFGGLYGHERRPGRFFAGRRQIAGGDAPVNMIHRDDAVEILRRIVHRRPEPGIINACAPQHPSRREFYTEWARRDGLDLPTWERSGGGGKCVLTHIPDELHFAFAYPDPMMPAP